MFSNLGRGTAASREMCHWRRFGSQTAVSTKYSCSDGDCGCQERNQVKYCRQRERLIFLPKRKFVKEVVE